MYRCLKQSTNIFQGKTKYSTSCILSAFPQLFAMIFVIDRCSMTLNFNGIDYVAGTLCAINQKTEERKKIFTLIDIKKKWNQFQLDVCLDSKLKTLATNLLNLAVFLLLAPLIISTLSILFVYRKIVEFLLRMNLRGDFMGFLEGTDCVWALEESTALSVINVLGFLEKNDATTSENFFQEFRNLVEKRLTTPNFVKLNWLREKKYGYYYWRKSEKIRIEDRIRWMNDDVDLGKCDVSSREIKSPFFNDILTELTNRPLPNEHSSSWEILVGRDCTKIALNHFGKMDDTYDNNLRSEKMIPVLFRVHHCLGDGVALLRLLLESIADSKEQRVSEDSGSNRNGKKLQIPRLRESSSILGIVKNEKEILYNEKYLLNASMPFTMRLPLCTIIDTIFGYLDAGSEVLRALVVKCSREEIAKKLENCWNELDKLLEKANRGMEKISKHFFTIVSIPNCLLQQALRSMDSSALHGPALSGKKLLSCWIEGEGKNLGDSNLLEKIRDIKTATDSRFGDVVLAALSENFHRYFSEIGESAPKTMTVVVPARMTVPSKKLNLQNEFSVGLLTLCCSEVNDELSSRNISEDTRMFERIGDVARSSKKLRNDPDYLINFWVMKYLSAVLPECLLRPVLESHSTLVFSNLPGPQEVSIIGNKMKNVIFWIPHRGTTGLGFSLLTYGGKVHLSIVADTALIRSQFLLDKIVRNTVVDIEKLHQLISLPCLAMKI